MHCIAAPRLCAASPHVHAKRARGQLFCPSLPSSPLQAPWIALSAFLVVAPPYATAPFLQEVVSARVTNGPSWTPLIIRLPSLSASLNMYLHAEPCLQEVVSARLVNGQCYGFVRFASAAAAATMLDTARSVGVELAGRRLNVARAQGHLPEWKVGSGGDWGAWGAGPCAWGVASAREWCRTSLETFVGVFKACLCQGPPARVEGGGRAGSWGL